MFDAYKVSVRLSLINGVSTGLTNIVTQLGIVNKTVDGTQSHFNLLHTQMQKIQKMGLIGGGVAATGFGLLHMFKGPIHEAKELQNQISNLNILGMKQAEISEVIAKSWKTSREVVTTTAAENIKTYRELRSAFGAGHEHEALGILPNVQRVGGILEAVTGKKQEGIGFDMVKGLELTVRGALSEELLQRRMGMMTKSIVGMGGTVDAHDFHMALKYAKSGAMSYSEDFLFKYLPTLIQEFKTGKHGGASSAGTALNAGYRMIVGQQISKENIQNWIDGGLIDKSRVAANAHHKGTSKLLAGAVAGAALYGENPEAWAIQFGLPAVQKLMTTKHITQDQAVQALTKDGNKSFLLNTLINKAQQFERDKKMIEQADSIEAYNKLIKTNPQLADMALHNQWKNLQAVLGYQVLPDVIKGTLWLIDKMKNLTEWFGKNEAFAKKLMYGFAGLATAMAIGGTLVLLKAGFEGLGVALKISGLKGTATGIAEVGKALMFPGVGSLGGSAGLAALGSTLTTLAGGLVGLGAACASMAWLLDWAMPNKPDEHGRRRAGRSSFGPTEDWRPAKTVDDHPGMIFQRAGRGGSWVPDPSNYSNEGRGQFIPPPNGPDVTVHVHNKLDEHGLTTKIVKNMGKAAERAALSSGSSFDPTRSPRLPGGR